MTNPNTVTELPPCPFCGGKSYIDTKESIITGCRVFYPSCLDAECPGFIVEPMNVWPTERQCIAAWSKRATPEPAGDLVERACRDNDGQVMVCTGCGTTDTIDWIKANSNTAFSCCPERKMVPIRAAIAAMPDHAAAYEDGYAAGELKWTEAVDKQIGIEESLRTQLAASQADVARLREALNMANAIVAAEFPHAPILDFLRATIKDTQP